METAVADETHLKLTDREHCLKRPDMFIGSVTPQPTEYDAFVRQAAAAGTDDDATSTASTASTASSTPASAYAIERRTAMVPPALSQLFLEIATNATDQAARQGTGVKNIKVTMDPASGEITVWNDGASIPVRKHGQFTDKYLTTVIFSEFRCGSNFDDQAKRTGAGRNGYGAKCVVAWSTSFTVEHHDGEYHFTQTWRDNLSHAEAPIVRKNKRKGTYTKVAFTLDYDRLGVTDIPAAIDYLRSFVWHLCPVTDPKLNVWLDGAKLPVRNLRDYAKLLSVDGSVIYDEGENMQVAVCAARPGATSWSVGFVNAIPCHSGTHVNHALNKIREIINKAMPKGKSCTAATLKGQVCVYVNLVAINPTFTSQTKEQLSLAMSKSGASWEPSQAFQRNLRKSAVAESVKLDQELRDTHKAKLSARGGGGGSRSRVVEVQDYESALNAGRANRKTPCTLILTEGLSAKGFAVAGLPNRDHFGVWPLRGKLKNTRGESLSSLLKTVEIANLLRILGVDLTSKEPYTDTSRLRYDRIMLCTDQDVDGAHISGLVINCLYCILPNLMRSAAQFVQRLATPLVRAWPKSGRGEEHEFLSEAEFETWHAALPADAKYNIKYYKGLGTSTSRDAKKIFANLDRYLVSIDCTQDEEILADFFDAKRAEQRREYLRTSASADAPLDYRRDTIALKEYLLGEVLPFSRYDNERSIAHVVDGLKPAQRKVLWTVRKDYGELRSPTLKVAQLSAIVAKATQYKHGEESLHGTIVRMAQDYPTCGNNLSLLVPEGQFGNRHGHEAASPRYIYTCGEAIACSVYPDADFPVLPLLETEGAQIEPEYMCPVIPMVLCNGSAGVGTGWSSDVPSFDPQQVIEWCRACNSALAVDAPPPPLDLTPHLEGFRGEVARTDDPARFKMIGKLEQTGPNTVRVYDLPTATASFLFSDKKKADVKWKEEHPHTVAIHSTDVDVDLTFHFDAPVTDAVVGHLRARSTVTVSLTNMHLWRADATAPHKFETVRDIGIEHARVRLATYDRRRDYQMDQLRQYITRVTDEYRFVSKVIEHPECLFRRARADVVADLEADGFTPIDGGYDHLLKMPFSSATAELLAKLAKDRGEAEANLDALEHTTVHQMWERELDDLEIAFADYMDTRLRRREAPEDGASSTSIMSRKRPAQAGKLKGVSRRPTKKSKA
jgi:DNA topoisomerase-2